MCSTMVSSSSSLWVSSGIAGNIGKTYGGLYTETEEEEERRRRGGKGISLEEKKGERDGGGKGVTSKVLCTDSAVRGGGGRQTDRRRNKWVDVAPRLFFFGGGSESTVVSQRGKKAPVFFLKGGRQCPDGLAAFQKPKNRKKILPLLFPEHTWKRKGRGKKDEKGPHPRLTGGNNFPFLLPLQIPPPPYLYSSGRGRGDLKFKREQKERGKERMYFSCAWK